MYSYKLVQKILATKDALKKEIQIDEITPNPKVILEQKRTHPERDAESHEFFLSGMEIHEPNPKCPIKLSYGLDGEIESVPSNNLCIPRSLMIGLNKSPFGSIEYPNNNSNILQSSFPEIKIDPEFQNLF